MRIYLSFFLSLLTLVSPLAADHPWTRCRTWFTTGAAVVGIGGGAWAGYVAGSNRQRFSGNVELEDPLCNIPKCKGEEVELSWILPWYDVPPGTDPVEVKVKAQIFRPDQSLFWEATLTPAGANPPNIPNLGPDKTQIGGYTIVLTLTKDAISFIPNVGVFLGGISWNGEAITHNPFLSGISGVNAVGRGTEVTYTIPFPDGPFHVNEELK